MAVETVTEVKRILYIAECPKCKDRVEQENNLSRERYCTTCHIWIPFIETSWTGEDYNPPDPNRPWQVR